MKTDMDLDSMPRITVWQYRTNHYILLGLCFFFFKTKIIITTLKNQKTKNNEMKIACTICTRLGAQQYSINFYYYYSLLYTAFSAPWTEISITPITLSLFELYLLFLRNKIQQLHLSSHPSIYLFNSHMQNIWNRTLFENNIIKICHEP